MPHCCENTSDGPCPKNVCNRTVKHTQGDLFFCPSCEAIRFRQHHNAAVAGKKRSAKTGLADRPKFGQKPTASLTKAEDEFCADCNEILDENAVFRSVTRNV